MGCLTFWWGRCDAPHHRVKLSAVSGADAFSLRLGHEILQAPRCQGIGQGQARRHPKCAAWRYASSFAAACKILPFCARAVIQLP